MDMVDKCNITDKYKLNSLRYSALGKEQISKINKWNEELEDCNKNSYKAINPPIPLEIRNKVTSTNKQTQNSRWMRFFIPSYSQKSNTNKEIDIFTETKIKPEQICRKICRTITIEDKKIK